MGRHSSQRTITSTTIIFIRFTISTAGQTCSFPTQARTKTHSLHKYRGVPRSPRCCSLLQTIILSRFFLSFCSSYYCSHFVCVGRPGIFSPLTLSLTLFFSFHACIPCSVCLSYCHGSQWPPPAAHCLVMFVFFVFRFLLWRRANCQRSWTVGRSGQYHFCMALWAAHFFVCLVVGSVISALRNCVPACACALFIFLFRPCHLSSEKKIIVQTTLEHKTVRGGRWRRGVFTT